MARRILRIAVYAYPPEALKTALEETLRGELNQYLECELIWRHAGECPLWGVHITLLDAITIIEDDRAAFVEAMRKVLAKHMPIAVRGPCLIKWVDNVFLRWKDEDGLGKLRQLRVEMGEAAHEFAVVERLDWEKVNELDRLLDAYGIDRASPADFPKGLRRLKEYMVGAWREMLYAPNVGLEWYIEKMARDGTLVEGKLPFPPSPHLSVASAVRADQERGWSANEVGDYITEHLPRNPRFRDLLGPAVIHTFASARVVEPLPPAQAIEITLLDRITGRPRRERRQPWVPTLELP